MGFNLNEIFCVIDKVQQAGLSSFAYQDADTRLHIKMQRAAGKGSAACESVYETCAGSAAPAGLHGMGMPPAGKAVSGTNAAAEEQKNAIFIESPMVGTFYAAPSAEEAPFIAVGDMVEKGQVVAIVEAMKLMNEVEAECGGIVEEILVENEQLVEYGQPLFRLRAVADENK